MDSRKSARQGDKTEDKLSVSYEIDRPRSSAVVQITHTGPEFNDNDDMELHSHTELDTACEIIKQQGGDIEVEHASGVDRGIRFTITLPITPN